MATITILSIIPVPGNSDFGIPATQSATFAVKGVDNQNYKWSRGGLEASLTNAQVQTQLNSESDSLLAGAIASGAPTMTQGQVNSGNYAWLHWSNRDMFAVAHYTYKVGMAGNIPNLAAYRTVLVNAYAELAPLAGTPFEAEFNNERAAASQATPTVVITGLPSGFTTFAQCYAFGSLLERWLLSMRTDVLWAKTIVGLA